MSRTRSAPSTKPTSLLIGHVELQGNQPRVVEIGGEADQALGVGIQAVRHVRRQGEGERLEPAR